MSPERTATPNPRDPRLNRSLPPRRTSLDAASRIVAGPLSAPRQYLQQPANPNLSDALADGPSDQFLRGLSDLVQAAVKTASLSSEKETLEKKKSTTGGLLKKAKTQSGFPATTAFFQQTWNDEGGHLARVDGALREHRSSYIELERALKANWTSSLPSGPNLDEKINQLKEEIEETKRDAKRSKDEAFSLKERNRSLEDTFKRLQARMTMLEKSLENHATSLTKQTKDNSSRLEQVSSEFEKRIESASAKVEESMSKKLKVEVDGWQKQGTVLGAEVKSIRTSQETFLNTINEGYQTLTGSYPKVSDIKLLDGKLCDFDTRVRSLESTHLKVSDIELLAGRLCDFDTRVRSLESTRTAPPESENLSNLDKASASHLKSRVQILEDILKELQGLLEMKDDLHFSEIETLKEKLVQNSKELESVNDNYNKLSDEVKSLHEANPSTALQQVANLSRSLQNTHQLVESIKVGLHSLETRYNTLTTEPLARNMVAAMHEMFPSAGQLIEQTSGLRTHVEKEIAALKKCLDNVFQNQNTAFRQMQQVQQEASSHLDELNRLKNDHASLSQSLAPLWEQFNAQDQSPTQDDLQKLQADLDTLSTKLEESMSKHDAQDQFPTRGDLQKLQVDLDILSTKLEESISKHDAQEQSPTQDDLQKLQADLDTLSTKLEESISKHDAQEQLPTQGDLQKLQVDLDTLSTKLEESISKHNAREQLPTQDDLQKLQAELNSLSTKLAENISKHDAEVRSRERSDERFMESLCKERTEVDSRVSQLTSILKKLGNDVEEVRSVNASGLAKVELHATDIESLRDGIRELEKTTLDQHQAFLDQLSEISKEHSTYGTDIGTLLGRISELEQSEKLRHKELHEQLDELKKAVEAKEFHPRAMSPIVIEDESLLSTNDSPTDPEEAARILGVAQINPTLALREKKKKKKKKRPRPSGLSEDDKPHIARPESPISFSSVASPFGTEETSTENTRRLKKKKRRKIVSTEPIPLD
ncbi:hypothetical protein BDV28DRAFT_82725 [Aspergillus coremiiformis]|uniref:Paramyosin n=1 Tax=Aspergillus coremiiformis TaxID=138285 RepID=A0A5N6ZG24_9EURO|nr:hypothetical protein BDV28DRAFT_82725 [Aspergillus coremiiformis]